MTKPNLIKATKKAIRESPREIFNWDLLVCTCIWGFSGVAKGFDEGKSQTSVQKKPWLTSGKETLPPLSLWTLSKRGSASQIRPRRNTPIPRAGLWPLPRLVLCLAACVACGLHSALVESGLCNYSLLYTSLDVLVRLSATAASQHFMSLELFLVLVLAQPRFCPQSISQR